MTCYRTQKEMVLIEKDNSPMLGKTINKILAIMTALMMIFISTTIFFNTNFLETGSREYVLVSNLGREIETSNLELDIEKIANEKVNELSKNAEINNWSFNKDGFLQSFTKVNSPTQEKKTITEQVKSNIDIVYNQYELKILKDNSTFYFRSEKEANEFKKKIGMDVKISKQEVSNLSQISNEDVLESKIAEVKKEKEIQSIRLAKVTSRSGSTIRKANSSGILPLEKYVYISSYYRSSSRPNHTGVDFAAPTGTKIYAYKSGTVTRASWYGGYGMCIEVTHSNGEKTRYAHCSRYNVSVGQAVSQGQVIGYVGSTGNSTGSHLHFEIMINGSFVNPLNYI